MAKFKVGDKVTDGSGVYLITGIDNRFWSYEWKLISGRSDPSHSKGGDFGWADAKMKIANACRNASFKVGDKVTYWMFDKKLDGSVKAVRGERVDIDDGHGGVVTFKAKDLEVWNAKACNSRNPIVARALNACTQNANGFPADLWATLGGSQMAREAAGRLKRGDDIDVLIKRFRDSATGSQIPGRTRDAMKVAEALEEMKRRGINACGTARNADINAELGRDVDRLDGRVKEELKKQAESYAYWLEADCGREINYLLKVADENKDVQPSIVAELKRLRKRVDDAIAASKRLPR